jgi:hypothetical protein
MAFFTIGSSMRANQRETALLMQPGDVSYHPRIGSMAPGTFISHSLFMDISMTTIALRLCSGKFKRSVALFAVNYLVLTYQRELCSFMIKTDCFQINLPATSFVAIVTIGFKAITVR